MSGVEEMDSLYEEVCGRVVLPKKACAAICVVSPERDQAREQASHAGVVSKSDPNKSPKKFMEDEDPNSHIGKLDEGDLDNQTCGYM